jgi:hypothetical protein
MLGLMKILGKLLLPLLLVGITYGMGAVAAPSTGPLVIIRFNQPHVHFERSLYNAVSKAVEVKPSVQFDIVSLTPSTGDAATDQQLKARAETNLRQVLKTMNEMGVPASRTSVHRQEDASIDASEVQIFVR